MTLTASWQSLIEQFIGSQAELGRSVAMQRQHRHRLGLFAEQVGGDPSTVSRPLLLDWVERTECSPLERRKRAQSLRIFFGWARSQGYVTINPATRLVSSAPSGPPRADFPAAWAEAFEGWANYMRAIGRRESTIETRRGQMARIGRQLAGIDPWHVTLDDLIDWLADKPQWKPQTRRTHSTTLRSFYRWAAKAGHIAQDPTIDLPPVRVQPGVPRPAPDDRIKLAIRTSDDRTALMLLVDATMGLRVGEITNLHTDDFTAAGLIINGKGNRERRVPIPEPVAAIVASLPHGYVFPRPMTDTPMTPKHVGKLMSRALGEGIVPHMLRHRYATVAYSAERDVLAVQKLLGHSKPETTQVYAQVADASVAAAAAAAAQL